MIIRGLLRAEIAEAQPCNTAPQYRSDHISRHLFSITKISQGVELLTFNHKKQSVKEKSYVIHSIPLNSVNIYRERFEIRERLSNEFIKP